MHRWFIFYENCCWKNYNNNLSSLEWIAIDIDIEVYCQGLKIKCRLLHFYKYFESLSQIEWLFFFFFSFFFCISILCSQKKPIKTWCRIFPIILCNRSSKTCFIFRNFDLVLCIFSFIFDFTVYVVKNSFLEFVKLDWGLILIPKKRNHIFRKLMMNYDRITTNKLLWSVCEGEHKNYIYITWPFLWKVFVLFTSKILKNFF